MNDFFMCCESNKDTMSTSIKRPADILKLDNWYLTLPIGEPKEPTNVFHPELHSFSIDKYFHVEPVQQNAVVFSAHAGGSTTKNTKNPRSELREMFGHNKAIWSTKTGKHTMIVKQAVTKLPAGKPSVVIAQVHQGSDDLIEVRCWIPKEGKSPVIDVFHDKTVYGVLCPSYKLGDVYTIKVQVCNSVIELYFNNAEKPTLTIPAECDTCFFKAGCYTQANPSHPGVLPSAIGEVHMYDLSVQHE